MRSPFVRFVAIFIVVVAVALFGFLYVTGRLHGPQPAAAPSAEMAPLPAAPAPAIAATPAQPQPLEAPPDVAGMNYPEVTVPGADVQAAAPVAAAAASPSGDYVSEIGSRKLSMPIEGLGPKDIVDTFNDARGGSKHEATDIMSPRGTPVHAIEEGNIVKLFTSKKGGLTIYEFDNRQKYCFYYAHLDKYADNLKEGMLVRPGQVIGYVGSTGDADARNPHLHFAISLLDPDKKYWKGAELNPYPILKKLVSSNN